MGCTRASINSFCARSIRTCKLKPTLLDELTQVVKADPNWQAIPTSILEKPSTLDKKLSLKHDLVCYKSTWYICNNIARKRRIYESFHDSKIAGHFGRNKTTERLRALFYWPKLDEETEEYVRGCDTCERDKASRHKKYGLQQPLNIPHRL